MVGKYWIRVKGRNFCEGVQGKALLVYEGAADLPDPPVEEAPAPIGIVLNPYNQKSSSGFVNTNELISVGKTGRKPFQMTYALYSIAKFLKVYYAVQSIKNKLLQHV